MSERFSRRFADAIRSWPFLLAYVAWTAAWFVYAGHRLGDPKPWLLWSVVTTLVTELDLIVYGIYQRLQTRDDEQMQRNQIDTMRLLVALAEHLTTEQAEQGTQLDEIKADVEGLAQP